jgi:uncharacterized membrane protein (Fun14 family)
MTIERIVRIVAGLFILLSLTLAHVGVTVNLCEMSWLWFTAFVGLHLFQSGITNLCPLVTILKKMGFKEAAGGCC